MDKSVLKSIFRSTAKSEDRVKLQCKQYLQLCYMRPETGVGDHESKVYLPKFICAKLEGLFRDIMKPTGTWHFKFQKSKVFVITKGKPNKSVLIRGEAFYNCLLYTSRCV